jgi:predicted ATPase
VLSPAHGERVKAQTASSTEPAQPEQSQPLVPAKMLRGMYVWGQVREDHSIATLKAGGPTTQLLDCPTCVQVGTGKSMLMDLFYHHLPVPSKRRVHFHEFMLDIHAR